MQADRGSTHRRNDNHKPTTRDAIVEDLDTWVFQIAEMLLDSSRSDSRNVNNHLQQDLSFQASFTRQGGHQRQHHAGHCANTIQTPKYHIMMNKILRND